MPQKADVTTDKEAHPGQENVVAQLPKVYGNGVCCEQTECIYSSNDCYCCHIYPPRNQDGYCKDFVSIND